MLCCSVTYEAEAVTQHRLTNNVHSMAHRKRRFKRSAQDTAAACLHGTHCQHRLVSDQAVRHAHVVKRFLRPGSGRAEHARSCRQRPGSAPWQCGVSLTLRLCIPTAQLQPTCSRWYLRPPCRKKRYSTAMSRQPYPCCSCRRCRVGRGMQSRTAVSLKSTPIGPIEQRAANMQPAACGQHRQTPLAVSCHPPWLPAQRRAPPPPHWASTQWAPAGHHRAALPPAP